MRYILAIAGLFVAAAVFVAVWVLIPHDISPPSVVDAAVAAPPTPPAATAADTQAQGQAADGSLRVCNDTTDPISVALGYKAPRGWQSEGWWVTAAGECKSVFNGKLDARYYYIYAADDVGGGQWDGTHFMCTRDETFTIFGVEDCLARGYERTGFFEVDTQNKNNWTLKLAEGEVVSTGDDASGDAVPLEGDIPAEAGTDQPTDEQPADEQGGDDTTPTDEGTE